MFTTMTLITALAMPGAPIPKDAPTITGVAPRIVEIKPTPEGKITVQVRRGEQVKMARPANAPANFPAERTIYKIMQVELSEIKDLKITTAGGKTVELKEAVEKLKDGGVVIMSNDGKAVDPGFLRILKDDIYILSSPELVTGGVNSATATTGVIRIQGGPGGVQIQPLPAIIPPAAPQVDPVPAPAPAVKPLPVKPAVGAKPAIGRIEIAPIAPAPPVEVEKK